MAFKIPDEVKVDRIEYCYEALAVLNDEYKQGLFTDDEFMETVHDIENARLAERTRVEKDRASGIRLKG